MVRNTLLRSSRSFLIQPAIIITAIGFITTIFAAGQAFAQTGLKIYGQVFDDQGPVGGATVTIQNSAWRSQTDQAGFYYFYDIPSGCYRIICRTDVYEFLATDNIAVDDAATVRRDIYVQKNILNLAPVYVEAEAPDVARPYGYIVKEYEVDGASNQTVEELVGGIPGLNLTQATATGEVFISAGGIRPEGINVLVDGRKVNSLLTGRADLNQLPLKAISRIEYYSPGVASTGADGGLGGTINFITKKTGSRPPIELSTERGSFGSEDYSVSVDYDKSAWGSVNANIENNYSRNEYKYIDYFGEVQSRANAGRHALKYNFAYANFVGDYRLKISGFGYSGENGVPGRIVSPSPGARSRKRSISLGGEIVRTLGAGARAALSYSFSDRKFEFEDRISFIPYSTDYIEKISELSVLTDYSHSGWLGLNAKLTFTENRLTGTDNIRPSLSLGAIDRDVFSLNVGARVRRNIGHVVITSSLSQAAESVEKEFYSATALAIGGTYFRGPVTLGFNSAVASSFRLPGLAELHWQEDVFAIANPDLRPEKSKSSSAEFYAELAAIGKWRLSLEYRDVRYRDLIFWRRTQELRYKPVNVSTSVYFATTSVLSYISPGEFVKVEFSRVSSNALNREKQGPYYGKNVTFQPPYFNRLGVTIRYAGFFAGADMLDSGHRYFLEANTKKLNAYTLINLKAGATFRFKNVGMAIETKIDNATNARYELLEYQPMPPRGYRVSLEVKL